MKKFKALFTSLALLLVCASSGFAAIDAPWIFTGDTTKYYNTSDNLILEFGSAGKPAAPGTGVLTLSLDIVANNWNAFTLKQHFNTVGESLVQDLYVSPVGSAFHFELPVLTDKSGIYQFELFSTGKASSTAYWELSKAQLSNSEPSKTPLPAAILLFGSGLVGMFGVNKVRRRGSSAA